MILLLFFVLGLIVGSILTLIGLRRCENESVFSSKSHCPNCKHILKWYELIPVLSWFIQKGKCRNCKLRISLVYPLIEIFTGVLYSLSYYLYGFNYEFFAMIIISSLMVIILVTDTKYMIILDGPLFLSYLCILSLKYYFFGPKTFIFSLISGFVIFLFMLAIKFIGDKVFKTESLGGGDIKLSMFFGFALGIRLGLLSLVLGCFLAFPYAVIHTSKKKNGEIPFGPFLIFGMLIIFLLETHILNLIDIIFKVVV